MSNNASTDTRTAAQRIGDVAVLIELVREYGFRGLILSDDADPVAVQAIHKLLDSAEWLVEYAKDAEVALAVAAVNSRDYGG